MKHYQSPRWSQEIKDCSMPMTFDQYGRCGYNCLYCFATFQKSVGCAKKNYYADGVMSVHVEKIKELFTLKRKSQFEQYIREGKTFQWGGMADPFCRLEQVHGVGLELLRFFREIDYQICFSTKGTWWLDDPRYTELFKDNPNWNVKVSIITPDEEKAAAIELGVPSVAERIRAIGKIAGLNCGGATLRLRPFIIGISNPGHQDLIRRCAEQGATAMSTEFLCVETRTPVLRNRLAIMSRYAGMDIFEFYKRYSSGSGYLRLNRNIKREYVDEMEQACKEHGVRFYVSDAHFKERSAGGSCCGLEERFNYSRGQFTEALLICKRAGEVAWSQIAGDLDYTKSFLYRCAEGYNTTSAENRAKHHDATMFDYLRRCWNNPKSGMSPYKMFGGIMKPTRLDASGDVVYGYDKSRE